MTSLSTQLILQTSPFRFLRSPNDGRGLRLKDDALFYFESHGFDRTSIVSVDKRLLSSRQMGYSEHTIAFVF